MLLSRPEKGLSKKPPKIEKQNLKHEKVFGFFFEKKYTLRYMF